MTFAPFIAAFAALWAIQPAAFAGVVTPGLNRLHISADQPMHFLGVGQGGDVEAILPLSIVFVRDRGKVVDVGSIEVKLALPVFNPESKEELAAAKTGIVAQVMQFEAEGFPLNALPHGTKISLTRGAPGRGHAENEVLITELLAAAREGKAISSGEDLVLQRQRLNRTTKTGKPAEYTRLDFRLVERSPHKEAAALASETLRAAQDGAQIPLASRTLEDLASQVRLLLKLARDTETPAREVRKAVELAGRAAMEMNKFHHDTSVEFQVDKSNRQKEDVAVDGAPANYWMNEEHLAKLAVYTAAMNDVASIATERAFGIQSALSTAPPPLISPARPPAPSAPDEPVFPLIPKAAKVPDIAPEDSESVSVGPGTCFHKAQAILEM